MNGETSRLLGVQILRLIAALMVVAQHGTFYTANAYTVDAKSIYALGLGTTGVSIFFVISGYVIGRQLGVDPMRFAAHRIARIYPAHLLALLLGGTLLLAVGLIQWDGVQFDGSLLLFPVGNLQNWSRVPYWTLIFEMYFYACAFLLMLGGRTVFDVGLVAWACGLLIANMVTPFNGSAAPDLAGMSVSLWALLFIGGAALARAHAGNTIPLVTIAVIVMATAYQMQSPRLTQMVLCCGATLAVIQLVVHLDREIARHGLLRNLARAGDWSYGLYLAHPPIMAAVATLLAAMLVPFSLSLAVVVVVSLVGALTYGWAEHTCHSRIIRPLIDRWSSAASRTPDMPRIVGPVEA